MVVKSQHKQYRSVGLMLQGVTFLWCSNCSLISSLIVLYHKSVGSVIKRY